MKHLTLSLFCLAGAGAILCGCGESKSPVTPSDEQKAAPASSAPAAAAPAAAPAAPALPVTPAVTNTSATVAAVKAAASDLSSQFAKLAQSQSDKLLGAIGTDLADKVKSLTQSPGVSDTVKTQLDSSLQSLMNGKDSSALNTALQPSQGAGLTAQQVQLAKEVGNLASAFVVQKNFAGLEGAQGDVATIVSSLRKGEITAALPPIQRVAQNASLTPQQKELVSSQADHYAPGLKKATDSLQQGLQGLQNLKGLGK
jgi:hypothetical protein